MNEYSRLVSIIIPCYNDHEYIEEAVESAVSQTWPNKEIILVDDGSNARTKKVLRELQSKVDQLITQENMGVSVARNNGIAKANGEYILVLDSDDYFEPEFCERALQVMERDSAVKLVTCFSRWFSNSSQRIFKPAGGDVKNFLMQNSAMGSALFRKNDWSLAGWYDREMKSGYEDWEFYIRLLKSGGVAVVINEVLFHYRNKESSRNKKAHETKYTIVSYIFEKHADIYKANFTFFMKEWLDYIEKVENYKTAVINSRDYKVGSIILKPFRLLGLFRK